MKIAFIGFGEAGQAISKGLATSTRVSILAWDKLFPTTQGQRLLEAAANSGIGVAKDLASAVRDAGIVVSTVTADSCLEAARQAGELLETRQLYLDMNSVAPKTKRRASSSLPNPENYVDIAIMGPVHPRLHRTPMFAAGKAASEAIVVMTALGMVVTEAGSNIGDAAAVKMIRGVLIKGIEALTAECLIAAEVAGVYSVVVSSLSESYPEIDWYSRALYNLERIARHGTRRGHEMREIADTLAALGVEPLLTQAVALRQFRGGAIGLGAPATDDACFEGRTLARGLAKAEKSHCSE